MARPKSVQATIEPKIEKEEIKQTELEKAYPQILEAFNWLKLKQDNDLRVQIVGVIPAGSDANYPINRYKLRFEHGEQLVVNETVLKMLFSFMGIQAKMKAPNEYETFQETLARTKGE